MSRNIRIMLWGGAALLWLLPLAAMQFSDEMRWTGFDFAAFGVMLLLACGAWELTVRLTRNKTCRAVAFLLAWVQGAVGIFD